MQEIHEIDSVACSSAQAINNINNAIVVNQSQSNTQLIHQNLNALANNVT